MRFTSGSCSSLSSRTLWWPGAECVCTHACVCFASGNRKRAREKQMGPLSFPLAWKMKGEENRNKKRKQLWQDNSSLWGGSQPEGGIAVCQDSVPRRWVSPNTLSPARARPPRGSPDLPFTLLPLVALQARLQKRRWNYLLI